MEVQDDAHRSCEAQYPCPDERVKTILALFIDGFNGILATLFDFLCERRTALAVALLDHFEDRRFVYGLVNCVAQKITTACTRSGPSAGNRNSYIAIGLPILLTAIAQLTLSPGFRSRVGKVEP